MRRLEAIRTLYEKQCERFRSNCWIEWVYRVAAGIGAGEPITDRMLGSDPLRVVAIVAQLRAWGIDIQIENEATQRKGESEHEKHIIESVEKVVQAELQRQVDLRGDVAKVVTHLPNNVLALSDGKTFHQAINQYRAFLEDTGRRDEKGNLVARVRKCCDRLRYLTEHHSDLPLWKLNLPQLEALAAYWRNRPATRKADRCSKSHAQDMIKELWRFLRWLDNHPDYHWQMPRGADGINRTPVSLPDDDSGEAFQTITKNAYTPEQLAQILRHTDAFGRALIAVCVNCAFGASEIGQWPTSKFSLNQAHPHADKLEMESSENDSWVTGKRPKTEVYGEHLLWPEVARAVAPFLDGRQVLPITAAGTPWYRKHSANPQSKFLNWWNALIESVRLTKPDFPRLPFGSLRDVLPDLLRLRYSDDVASLALQHGKISDDPLLQHYANMPFRRLFEATRELRSHFQPMLDELVKDVS